MKIALIHDFLFEYAGSERVVEQILELFPEADLFSLVDFLPGGKRGFIRDKPVRTSFIQNLPLVRRNPAKYLPYYVPLMGLAVEQFDLNGYDLVISSSHTAAKGVITGPDQLHIAYIHSPMRYAWDQQGVYIANSGWERGPTGILARIALSALRSWDVRSTNGVDVLVANSHFIARRIWKTYRRPATVIYPPVDVKAFEPVEMKEDYYLVVSRLVPYKRVDLVIQAFNRLPDRRLLVAGNGPEIGRLRAIAGPNIEILGYQTDRRTHELMQNARALVIAAAEDFGIAPVEAQACGTPVIAFHHGGAAETVRGADETSPTGYFFEDQEVDCIRRAVTEFDRLRPLIHAEDCRANALRFSPENFRRQFGALVETEWRRHQDRLHPEHIGGGNDHPFPEAHGQIENDAEAIYGG